ncbi:hypothetical protein NDU88_002008 [Pleurodeles waltl]|uniref:Uncharacterized protein n=1 Tax=Pleurodeles waltl TaxID=8319 RepID=A0AAV7Q5Y1_PLEWA|nr:hypothetical protein NDU88_002008 [Pleurodeles waltl]
MGGSPRSQNALEAPRPTGQGEVTAHGVEEDGYLSVLRGALLQAQVTSLEGERGRGELTGRTASLTLRTCRAAIPVDFEGISSLWGGQERGEVTLQETV